MKNNKVKLYAQALAEVILADEKTRGRRASTDSVAGNFVRILEKDGQMRKVKEILNLAEDFLLAKQGKSKITIETARKMTASQKKIAHGFAHKGDVISEKINPELIAGIKIIVNNSKQFDASMQRKLQNIF